METAQILLVDDDPALLQALPRAVSMRMSNVQVHTAASATQALELLHQREYDAIVSDIKMPGMDGLALLAITSQQYPEVPVLLITGHGEHDLAIRALRGGAYDYLLKPIDRDDLLASLSRALHTRRLQQEIQVQQQALEHYALDLERLVEQRTSELRAVQTANEAVLSTMGDELKPILAQLKQATQQIEACLPATGKPRTLDQSLADMISALQQLENVAAGVQKVTSRQSSHLAYK
jgi:two-component system, sensor histidine kinase and response regulator